MNVRDHEQVTVGAVLVLFIQNRLVAGRVVSDPGNPPSTPPRRWAAVAALTGGLHKKLSVVSPPVGRFITVEGVGLRYVDRGIRNTACPAAWQGS